MLVLIGLISAVIALPAVDEIVLDDISDGPTSIVTSSVNNLQEIAEGKSHAGWSRRRRNDSRRRRRRLFQKVKTHFGCSGYYNRCMCGSSFTCWFKKKTGNKKLCSEISSLCKLVGNNPKLVTICKEEAKNLLGSDPTGTKTGVKELMPIVNSEKAEARAQIKKLITGFYNALSDTCKAEAKKIHTEMLSADKKTRGKLMKDFDKNCIMPRMNGAKQEMALLLQLKSEDHKGFWLSVFIENMVSAIFG